MAPDKIYINNYNGNDTLGNQWHSKPIQSPSVVSHEYIRKDALLGWAREELSKASSSRIGRRNAFIDVVDKLNSM